DQLTNVQQIQATHRAFAAIIGDGSVVTWGAVDGGGDSSAVQDQLTSVQQICASNNAFAAILGDGSVVTWNLASCHGEQLKNVQQIKASDIAFAAILGDGSVVTWGAVGCGSDSSAVQDQLKNVQQIQATEEAFAAILCDGWVERWTAPAAVRRAVLGALGVGDVEPATSRKAEELLCGIEGLRTGALVPGCIDIGACCGSTGSLYADMAKQARTRIYGNDTIDSMPELVQEWYHAVGTPMGVGNMAWAKECVKKGVDVNARLDAYGGTALFLAIEQGNWDMMKWLVEEAKVDLEILDYGGYNALDYAAACHWHHPDRPPMLPGGKPAPMDIASFLKGQGMQHTWFGAALAEDIDRLWEFLENGQDVNERGGHFNKSALEEAADNGGYWTAKFLMVKGGQVSVTPNWIYSMSPESHCTANIQGKLAK
ncbi:unnamed protein product, partial [Symbiodinium sp. KB8]